MRTPILETDRIILRPMLVTDAEHVFYSWTSDPEVAKYMIWDLHKDVEDTIQWLRMEETNVESDKAYNWGFVLKETGLLFGSGGINFKEERGMYELGYNIMRKYWNQGLTTEASKAILEFAVNQLGARKFLGCHAKDNVGSGKVMEKLGFIYQKEGSYTDISGDRFFMSKEYLLDL